MVQDLIQIIDFVKQIDELKAVLRKTRPLGMERYENSAEHSWQVTLAALMLKDYAAQPVDINRVLRMLLIHDLCEIDTGDVIVYAAAEESLKRKIFPESSAVNVFAAFAVSTIYA